MSMHAAESTRTRRWLAAATLLVVAWSAWHVLGTHTRLSHTVDEPTHIALGLEWLEHRTQRVHPENPPVSRVAVAVGPYLAGHRLPPEGLAPRRGVEVLYDGDYQHNLALARRGVLPFFLLAAFLAWYWASRLGGPWAGLLATASLATLPPVLGHAGLATTDVPFMAMFAWAILALTRWLDTPSAGRAVHLGLAIGAALATKFSTLLFFPPAFVALALARWLVGTSDDAAPRRSAWLGGVLAAAALAGIVLWASYGFAIGRLAAIPGSSAVIAGAFPEVESLGRRILEFVSVTPIPAPDALYGFLFLSNHSKMGHLAYLMGEASPTGFLAFYPVALAVRTPLTFLFLCAVGSIAVLSTCRRNWQRAAPLVAAATVLATAMPTSIHMGLRHLLHIYPLLAVATGIGVARFARSRGPVVIVGLLLAWQVVSLARTFPDYIAYFNPMAGDEPGEVLVDSDLDWGQDVLQLRELCEENDIDLLHIAYFGNVRLCEHGLPDLRWLPPGERVGGWVAVSEMYFRDHWHNTFDDPCDRSRRQVSTVRDGYAWLEAHELVAVAGGSIRVYRVRDD